MSTQLDAQLNNKNGWQNRNLSSFPKGRLDLYRNQATFNYKDMKDFVNGSEDITEFKERVWGLMEKDPVFSHDLDKGLSIDGMRRLAMRRCKRIFELDFLNEDEFMGNPFKHQALTDVIGSYDWGLAAKHSLNSAVSFMYIQYISLGNVFMNID